MAAKFEYDESGGTFLYFFVSFYALVLIPFTYYFFKGSGKTDVEEEERRECHCEPCRQKKLELKEAAPNDKKKQWLYVGLLALAWCGFLFFAYQAFQVEREVIHFDPFEVLGIDPEASIQEIKRKYRQLSLKYHPDKEGGDPAMFLKISKAHQALTDEESKKNWQMYGNPDGPGVTTFGIALPAWIVEEKNSIWILAIYILAFVVILPIVVGTWWYRSIRYSGDQILLSTSRLYFYFFNKTPNMNIKRMLMVLGSSAEFDRFQNQEVQSRLTDNEEVPRLMKELYNFNRTVKERPFSLPYAIKSRALLHAHFSHHPLPAATLAADLKFTLQKCPFLIQEMISVCNQLFMMAYSGRGAHEPHLTTIENCFKISQMVVQALWEKDSPLLQLPHITDDQLRHFHNKRRNIRSLRTLANMKNKERRNLLRNLDDEQYTDVTCVLGSLPVIQMDVHVVVLDDEEDKNIVTEGDIVTVKVKLARENMEVNLEEDIEELGDLESDEDKTEKLDANKKTEKPKIWEKKGKWKGKKKKPVNKKPAKQPAKQPQQASPSTPNSKPLDNAVDGAGDAAAENSGSEESKSDDDEENNESSGSEAGEPVADDVEGEDNGDNDSDDFDWDQEITNHRKKALETVSRITHQVHCPYFPVEKQEWWWLYICDRVRRKIIVLPKQIVTLKNEEEIKLQFQAPPKIGSYKYTVCLRSDSYMDLDLSKDIKLEVQKAQEREEPQWELSEDEENDEGDDESGLSDYTTDEDD